MADDAEDGEAEEVTAGGGEVGQGVHGVQFPLVSVSGREALAGEGR